MTRISCARILNQSYQSPPTPILSDEATSALRTTAQRYFEKIRDSNNGAWGMEQVDLDELFSTDAESDVSWKKELDDALTQNIYPLIRSGWPSHDALSGNNKPVLTVTSATLVTGWGCPGGKATLTPLDRDAGLFVAHIDLGNDGQVANTASEDTPVMGALYLESLIDDDGPLKPGQMVVHRSNESTSAIVVPSDIHSLEQKHKSSLDTVSRRQILKAAERTRHYALRLVLTTKTESNDETDIPEAPSEERSYRLRETSRLLDSRMQYLTLASEVDLNDAENHLRLGINYLVKISSDNQLGLDEQSYIDKAVFHFEKAAALCPTDARTHSQLATALRAKLEYEQRLHMEGADRDYDSLESVYLNRMRDALERSVQLGSAAVRVCANGIDDLSLSLHKLAETLCRMGELDAALDVIDKWAECGSLRSALAVEDKNHQHQSPIPSFKWIQAQGDDDTNTTILNRRDIALTTVGDLRVFEPADVSLLRAAADKHFAQTAGQQTSRYTMQYEGNSEVHLDDLCSADPDLKLRIDRILQEKVYPLVRAAFGEDEDEPEPKGSICVYDSIFVRYNAEQAKAAGLRGASQPLHQDGGIYSVNIALNEHLDDSENGFTGGGTFFEALTVGDGDDYIQRPSAPGHAIIHKTTQRHAGAPTTSGVRDILVIFLTARQPEKSEIEEVTWRVERAMRLTPLAKQLSREKLISCLKLATKNDPTSHALPYALGVHLTQEGDMNDPSDERWEEICQGVESFERSIVLNPADARAHYNLGMALSDRHKYAMRTRRMHLLPPPQEAAESLINALETAIQLEIKCDEAGCSNGINIAEAFLTLGDFVLRLKNFDLARLYLNQVEECIKGVGDTGEDWAQSMLQQVSAMLDYIHENEAIVKL
eukprot:CAMPEP_0113379404 /NCGR_PEP_ID=MMETSP0013_2-20120614/4206_1 /TAXON_ID=2843 ORGANISM="Skeletonema costatum, Strain 1716" /NCGR_SAMPLE_ID=MMETSP0013_2 /ASSEMBLY_ACC=CAM_ASM_000158 /LENGTH=883 /DNA_ID=CAMNT_0000261673 /DNA_START=261 /DNA_END=2912 /DNA_ORIENTATION=- /assembly_acc=CAM_ASM_000158